MRSRVLIDWTADLATLRHGPVPEVPVIRLSDGTTPSWTRVPDGNSVLLDYASDLYARLREVPALDMTILVPSCPFRSVSVSPNALHYRSVWGWLEVSRSRIRLAGIDYGPAATGDRIVLRRDGLLFVNGAQRLPTEPGG